MPSLSNGETRRQLSRKFNFTDVGGTRHDSFELRIGNSLVATVDVERHRNDIRDGLISLMARQLGVGSRQFREMIQCTMSAEAFLKLKGIEPTPQIRAVPTLTALEAASQPSLEAHVEAPGTGQHAG